MEVLTWLIPISLTLGAVGLGAFVWTLRSGQYDDPEGDAARILSPDYDDRPKRDEAEHDLTSSRD